MQTEIIKITEKNKKEILEKASNVIKNGGLVVFPTETVYGVGANVFNEGALRKIFISKGRPSDNPLIVHISDISQISSLVEEVSQIQKKLIDIFWPGPLTIIFEKKNIISNIVSGGLSTIAIRMPSNIFARDFIRLAGVPIAAPSANISGRPSGTVAKDIYDDLSGKVEMILDDGKSNIGVESTVIKIENNRIFILRPGAITKEMLEKVLFPLKVFFTKNKNNLQSSPGTKYKHYAPKARLEIVSKKKMQNKVENFKNKGNSIGIICTNQNKDFFQKYKPNVFILGDENNLKEISQKLYSALRFFDTKNVDIIFCQNFFKKGLGVAIMDRLERASAKI